MNGHRFWLLALTGAWALSLAAAFLAISQRTPAPDALTVTPLEATSAAPVDGQIKAYITGAIQRPGVYTVRIGDRVADLVEMAGGPTEEAELSAVNFARRIRDEDQVLVPRRGEPVAEGAAVSTASGIGGRIDINTAASHALETLPGIGPARAQRIVESRTKDGPYVSTTDLVKRKLVPQSVYDSIKDLIDVRP